MKEWKDLRKNFNFTKEEEKEICNEKEKITQQEIERVAENCKLAFDKLVDMFGNKDKAFWIAILMLVFKIDKGDNK